jgi:Tol biopolymer transport system component
MSLAAQVPAPAQVRLSDALPIGVRPKVFSATADAQHTYYSDSIGQIWVYDHASNTNNHIVTGTQWDLTVAPSGNALAFTRGESNSREQFVWVVRLDSKSGLALSAAARITKFQGDSPAISPDGRFVAYARDDSTGVGQSLVVAPVPPEKGVERVLVSSLGAGMNNIAFSHDGKTIFFGVNAPVACNPDWSCLPPRVATPMAMGTVRRVDVRTGAVTVLAPTRAFWPGLSPDGALMVYRDSTVSGIRFVLADSAGNRIDTIKLLPRQTLEGWFGAGTLAISGPVTPARLPQ